MPRVIEILGNNVPIPIAYFFSFVEISFLRLVHMDLSANRISTLPVELRFMISVVDLNLGENPLTCPPANVSFTTHLKGSA